MEENTNFEVIHNKLDALIETIVQKENSDENFRVTYAHILERINTKMDVFSSSEDAEKIGLLIQELKNIIQDRQEIVDNKFNAIKGEFDNIHNLLANSLKTPEIVNVFTKIEEQIHYFAEEQENQKFAFNSIISHIEKTENQDEVKDELTTNFSIVKEQNTIINENLNKQIDIIKNLEETIKDNDKKSLNDLNTIIFSLKDLSESLDNTSKDIESNVKDKIAEVLDKIQETNSFVDVVNSNITTLVEVVGNIFEDEDFTEAKSNIADLLVKTTLLSETLNKMNEELSEQRTKVNEALEANSQKTDNIFSRIEELEEKLLKVLDFSDLQHIKDFTEKMFFQGTEVLKEEIWAIKDIVKEVNEKSSTNVQASEEIKTLVKNLTETLEKGQSDIADYISEESVAASAQLTAILEKMEASTNDLSNKITEDNGSKIAAVSEAIGNLKNEISDIVLNQQNEQLTEALNKLQTKFITQIVQIADNISFSDEADEINDNVLACTDELKDKISEDVAAIQEMLAKVDSLVSNNISNDIKALISGFKILTNGVTNDNKDYIYTLPDIESDLTRISLEINTIKKSIFNNDSEDAEEAENNLTARLNIIKEKLENLENSPLHGELAEVKRLFRSVSEDISSISKRTNKLIITSDSVNKTLKNNIDAFSSLISNFEKQNRAFYNSAFVSELHVKVDNVTKLANNILKSDQVMNEAFMYLAEWVDTTTDTFNDLQEDVTKIKNEIFSDEEKEVEKLTSSVIELNLKIEEQAQKIETIEEKLDTILSQQNEAKELRSLLEYVVEQVNLTNEKLADNDKLAQDIASFEKQLKKIGQNIDVITEYLDEEYAD